MKGMTGRIIEDDTSEQPFRVKLRNGKLSWFKEAWIEDASWGSRSYRWECRSAQFPP